MIRDEEIEIEKVHGNLDCILFFQKPNIMEQNSIQYLKSTEL